MAIRPVDEPTSDSCVDVIIGTDGGHQHIPLGVFAFRVTLHTSHTSATAAVASSSASASFSAAFWDSR